MRDHAIILQKTLPMLFDCGEFILSLCYVGVVPSDEAIFINPHKHEFFELHYIDTGKGTNKINDSTQKTIYSGQMYLAKPNEIHQHTSIQKDNLQIMFLGFDILKKPQHSNTAAELANRLNNVTSLQNQHFFLRSIFIKIIRELSNETPSQSLILKGLLMELIGNLIRPENDIIQGKSILAETTFAMERCKEYIHSNINKKITINDLARITSLSESHFRRQFQRATTKTCGKYIIDYKMELAQEMLTAQKSIKEIAYSLGYESPENFTKAFKNQIGTTPILWRNK